MGSEFGVNEDYEAMIADIGGKPTINKDGINEDYEAMVADMPTPANQPKPKS